MTSMTTRHFVTPRNGFPAAHFPAVRARKGRWWLTGLALSLAVVLNLALIGILAGLSRSAHAEKPPPARLTWVTLQKPTAQTHLRVREEQVRRSRPEEKQEIRPKVHEPLLAAREIQPRALKPRMSVVPSLDIHPELSDLSLQFTVNLPGLSVPSLPTNLRAYSVSWSFEAPDFTDASVEEPQPAEEPAPQPEAKAPPEPEPEPERPAEPIKVREPERMPVPVYAPRPQYPLTALRRGVEGHVVLRIHVGIDGKVVAVEGTGYEGHESFVRAAEDAVKRWRFRPAMREGRPVAYWCAQKISFSLAKD